MIEARDITKRFGDHTVLAGVSFRIDRGESAANIGRSGTGKSVLLKHLVALLQPDEGEVLLNGQPATAPETRGDCRTAMVFQGGALLNSLTLA